MGLRNRKSFTDVNCFFVTTTCHNHLYLLKDSTTKDIIVDSLNFLANKYQCLILAYVIMPNHIHLILYFPEENRLSDFIRDFKKFTSVKIRRTVQQSGDAILAKLDYQKGEQKYKVWMDRFDDVYITSTSVFHTKLDYIHNNPLQEHWKLADSPEQYPYSSAAYYLGANSGKVNITNYIEYFW